MSKPLSRELDENWTRSADEQRPDVAFQNMYVPPPDEGGMCLLESNNSHYSGCRHEMTRLSFQSHHGENPFHKGRVCLCGSTAYEIAGTTGRTFVLGSCIDDHVMVLGLEEPTRPTSFFPDKRRDVTRPKPLGGDALILTDSPLQSVSENMNEVMSTNPTPDLADMALLAP